MNSDAIQLLVLDIDGTIAGDSNDINDTVITAIQAAQAQGIQVAIATGRMYRSALRFHRTIGSTLPLMTYQGALVKDPQTNMTHRHWTIPLASAHGLLEDLAQPEWRDRLTVHAYVEDVLYVKEMRAETISYAERSGIEVHPIGDLQIFLTMEPTKILAMCDDPTVISELLATLRQRYGADDLYMTTSVPTFFEATHPQVNKGTAVQYVAEEYLGLKPHNVMAIGDNFNDVEMLQYAGLSVAMGNAPDPVKAIADWVTTSVEEDGAAAAIAKFLL